MVSTLKLSTPSLGGKNMRLTSKGRYAVRAVIDLAIHSKPGEPQRLQEISDRQDISLHYLEQLFRRLRKGNVVKSVRGPGGGYVLATGANQITIKDILGSVGENINPAKDIIGKEEPLVNTREFHLTKKYFLNLAKIMDDYLTNTTLADLMVIDGGVAATTMATTTSAVDIVEEKLEDAPIS